MQGSHRRSKIRAKSKKGIPVCTGRILLTSSYPSFARVVRPREHWPASRAGLDRSSKRWFRSRLSVRAFVRAAKKMAMMIPTSARQRQSGMSQDMIA